MSLLDLLAEEFPPGAEVTLVLSATVKSNLGSDVVEVSLHSHEATLCFSTAQLRAMHVSTVQDHADGSPA